MWDPTGIHPSGGGSAPELNIKYLLLLQSLVGNPKINKIVEIGFGDFQLTGLIIFEKDKRYIGYDVVKSLLRENKENK
jgi:hypothetical protein